MDVIVGIVMDQYKLLWDLLQQETSRFWAKFNILLTIQIALSIGMIQWTKGDDGLRPIVETFLYVLLLLLNFITFKLVQHTIEAHDMITSRILKFEENDSSLKIVRCSTAEDVRQFCSNYSFRLVKMIPVVLLVVWVCVLLKQLVDLGTV